MKNRRERGKNLSALRRNAEREPCKFDKILCETRKAQAETQTDDEKNTDNRRKRRIRGQRGFIHSVKIG